MLRTIFILFALLSSPLARAGLESTVWLGAALTTGGIFYMTLEAGSSISEQDRNETAVFDGAYDEAVAFLDADGEIAPSKSLNGAFKIASKSNKKAVDESELEYEVRLADYIVEQVHINDSLENSTRVQ